MLTHVKNLRRRVAGSLVATVTLALAVPLLQSGPALADTAPVPPVTQTTVSADALPTVQMDGVAWAQVVVGNRVYVTGKFSQARPAGSAAGTNQTARSNILAYDLTTGALISSWAPSLNAQGLAIAASADGTRIYVAGDFTSVSGVARSRIVALDATTGAVLTGFNASVNSQARALAVVGSTVYAGGGFTTAGGQPRQRLAAFNGTTGAVLAWAPTVDQAVMALTAVPAANEVIAGRPVHHDERRLHDRHGGHRRHHGREPAVGGQPGRQGLRRRRGHLLLGERRQPGVRDRLRLPHPQRPDDQRQPRERGRRHGQRRQPGLGQRLPRGHLQRRLLRGGRLQRRSRPRLQRCRRVAADQPVDLPAGAGLRRGAAGRRSPQQRRLLLRPARSRAPPVVPDVRRRNGDGPGPGARGASAATTATSSSAASSRA